MAVQLEAFSPFIPLNVDDSSLPATVMSFQLKNTSNAAVDINVLGELQNAICLESKLQQTGQIHNRVVNGEGFFLNKQVIQTLRKFGREKQSGVLTCQSVEVARRMVFSDGEIVGARSSSTAERLGEVMVRHGHITEQHLNDATIFARKGRRLGEVLAELNIIKMEDVENYVRLQVLEICSSVILEPPCQIFLGRFGHRTG